MSNLLVKSCTWGSKSMAKSMFIPQRHIREAVEDSTEIEPFVVELWENGNYNEEGGDVGDKEWPNDN